MYHKFESEEKAFFRLRWFGLAIFSSVIYLVFYALFGYTLFHALWLIPISWIWAKFTKIFD